MYVERTRLVRLGPFDELEVSFVEPGGEPGPPRMLTLVHGDGGTGKSTLLAALAQTRPGKAMPPTPEQRRGGGESYVVCLWTLSTEDPRRPHALRVASPHLRPSSDDDDQLWRREQAHFDRRATEDPGYAFVDIPAQRWFPRASVGLNDPARAMMRYDVRAGLGAADATRLELTRPCKQAMAYAAISSALAGDRRGSEADPRVLAAAMSDAVDAVARLVGYRWRGVEPHTFEPLFESPGGRRVSFDLLPAQVKHLVAFVAIPVRMLWAAHRGQDPRECDGVVTIDDFEMHLSPAVYGPLMPALRRALPRAQWILTTSSPYAAAECDADSLVALRRHVDSDLVSIYEGELALTH